MIKLGIISDTHSFIDQQTVEFLKPCDKIIHCGDWGELSSLEKLLPMSKVLGVYGNIDGQDIRSIFDEFEIVTVENVKILITHIGGYPGKYNPKALKKILEEKPNLFLAGHSHILKVIFDKKYNLLHVNPGAAGNSGFHKVKTAIRLDILDGKMSNLEIFELKRQNEVR